MTAPVPAGQEKKEKNYQELSLAEIRNAFSSPAKEIGERYRGFVIENLSIDPNSVFKTWKNGIRFISVSDENAGHAVVSVSRDVWQRALDNGYNVTNEVSIDVAIETLYVNKRMQLQIAALAIRVTGQSQLEARRDAINDYCEQRGYFTRKKIQCPAIITRIAIISTEGSTIESDITRQIGLRKDRISSYRFDGTPEELKKLLASVIAKQRYDIICLYRGGREDEAMFVYSDPMVLDTIVASKIPIASALGHERDVPPVQRVVSLGCASPSKLALFVRERNDQAQAEAWQLMREINTGFKSYLKSLKHHAFKKYSEIKEAAAKLKRLNDQRKHRRNMTMLAVVAVAVVAFVIWVLK